MPCTPLGLDDAMAGIGVHAGGAHLVEDAV